MYTIRLVSAFLFSLVAIFFLYLGVWHLSVKRMEGLLPSKIEGVLGKGVTYSSIEQHLNPGRMEMVLKNVQIHKESEHGFYIQQVGDVLLSGEFWEFNGFQLLLPSRQTIHIKSGTKEMDYELWLERARLDVVLDENYLKGFSFSTDAHALKEVGGAVLLEGDYAYYSCLKDAEGECGLTFTGGHILGQELETLSASWLTKLGGGKKPSSVLDIWLDVLTIKGDSSKLSYLFDHAFEAVHGVELLSSHIENDGFWVSLNGDVKGGGHAPEWEMSLTSNKQDDVLNYLLDHGFLNLYGVRKLRSLNLLISGSRKSYTVSYALKDNQLQINGDIAGDVKSTSQLLRGVYAH